MKNRTERRSSCVKVRLTETERRELKAIADKAGMTVSDAVRTILPEALRPRPKADPELVRQVARIGNNVNQLTRWVNIHKPSASEPQVLFLLAQVRDHLRELLETDHAD